MSSSRPTPLSLAELSALCANKTVLEGATERQPPLPLGLSSLDEQLPDGGLPRGSVIEVTSPAGLSGATRLALAACASVQRESTQETMAQDDQPPWCAWVDASHSLFAPGVLQTGVDLEQLLVVRPEPSDIARVAVRLVTSQLFSIVVVDRCGIPGAEIRPPKIRWDVATRRLALALQGTRCSVLLLSTTRLARTQTLPTAMRIELSKPSNQHIEFRVAKDRRGHCGRTVKVPLQELQALHARRTRDPFLSPFPQAHHHDRD